MGKIEELAKRYGRHIEIKLPEKSNLSGAQRVVIVVYDKKLERTLRSRKGEFKNATENADQLWSEVDLTDTFSKWIANQDYREDYFSDPKDMYLTLEADFPRYVAAQIRTALQSLPITNSSILAVFGVGSLFGFTRFSEILKLVEQDIHNGRLVIFFPGHYENNNYRLLDARDGWNYLAVPITLHSNGGEP